jgi:hypothetical protein
MGKFCSSCGAETAGGRFCPKCGTPQVDTPPSAQPASQAYAPSGMAAPPPVKKGSNALKIGLIVVGVFLLLGIAGVVGTVFFVKNKIEEVAQSSGGTSLREALRKSTNALPTHAGCEILSKEKVSEILGEQIVRTNGNEAGAKSEICMYWADGESSDTQEVDSAKEKDGQPSLRDLEDLAKTIQSASKNRPALSVTVFRGNGQIGILTIKTATALSGTKNPAVEGPWDEAYFGPVDSLLAVRKGDNGILLDLTKVANKREAGIALAKAMIAGI